MSAWLSNDKMETKKETPVFESRKLDIADIPDIPEITWHQSTQRISPIEYPRNNVITIEPHQPQQSPNTPSSERFFQQYTTETELNESINGIKQELDNLQYNYYFETDENLEHFLFPFSGTLGNW